MSQQGMYPNLSKPPVPAAYHVQNQPDRWSNVESPKTPLIHGAPQYAIYNPKRAIVYAQKSRSHCCCVASCAICTICCCLFFVISIVLGGLVAAYAVQCGKIASDQVVYSANANVTQLEFVNYNGPISLSSSNDALNVTITVTRRAATSDEIGRFTTVFNVNDGKLYFEEQLPGKNNFWEALINCVSSEIDVVIPATLTASINVTSHNGGLTINLANPLGQAAFTTTNGDVELNVIADSVSATSTNGDIKLLSVATKSFTGKTINGDVKAKNNVTLLGVNETLTFDVTTTNGDISIPALIASPRSNIHMGSTNGDISATIAKFAGSFDLKTTNGGITVKGNQVHLKEDGKKEKQGTNGDGDGSCNVKTTNGDVTVSFV